MNVFEKIRIGNEREIRVLGASVLQYGRTERNGISEKYIEIFSKSFESKVLDRFLSQISTGHDHVWLIRAGLGEAYLLNFMLDELISKYQAKNPCLICHRKTYKEVFNLYHPQIPFYHIDGDVKMLFPYLINRNVKYKNTYFHINPSTLYEVQRLFADYEKGIENRHYAEVIKEFNGISEFSYKSAIFNEDIEKRVIKKTKELNRKN